MITLHNASQLINIHTVSCLGFSYMMTNLVLQINPINPVSSKLLYKKNAKIFYKFINK